MIWRRPPLYLHHTAYRGPGFPGPLAFGSQGKGSQDVQRRSGWRELCLSDPLVRTGSSGWPHSRLPSARVLSGGTCESSGAPSCAARTNGTLFSSSSARVGLLCDPQRRQRLLRPGASYPTARRARQRWPRSPQLAHPLPTPLCAYTSCGSAGALRVTVLPRAGSAPSYMRNATRRQVGLSAPSVAVLSQGCWTRDQHSTHLAMGTGHLLDAPHASWSTIRMVCGSALPELVSGAHVGCSTLTRPGAAIASSAFEQRSSLTASAATFSFDLTRPGSQIVVGCALSASAFGERVLTNRALRFTPSRANPGGTPIPSGRAEIDPVRPPQVAVTKALPGPTKHSMRGNAMT